MAVYKVIQDVEAEDKLLGPLTLKKFIYAGIAVLLGFISFRVVIASTLGPARWFVALIFFFPMLLFGLLASPIGREQPTEVWLLSRLRFFIKTKKRIWDQSGVNHLVTITAPTRVEKRLVKDLNPAEVKSRLGTLANTLDSRGWAIKNVAINDAPLYAQNAAEDSDRLIGVSALAQPGQVIEVRAADDIMDDQNNAVAQHFSALMRDADDRRKVANVDKIDAARQESQQPQPDTGQTTKKEISKKYEQTSESPVTAARRAVNMDLAQSGNAFSVASLAKLANRSPEEVVIQLH